MAIEYGFINEFPAILLDSIANVMYYMANNAGTYVSLFFTFIVAGLLLGMIAYILYHSFGLAKKNYNWLISVMR